MPMYAMGTKDLSGGGRSATIYTRRTQELIKLQFDTGICRYAFGLDEYSPANGDSHYSNILHYSKLDSKIIFSFLEKNRQEKFRSEFTLRNIIIFRDIPYYINYEEVNKDYVYWQVEFKRKNTNPLKSSLQKINLHSGKNFLSHGEIKDFFTYGKRRKVLT